MKNGKNNIKEAYYDYTIIHKRLRLNILRRSKVTRCSCNYLEFYKTIFYGDIFVTVFVFLSFKMSEFKKVLQIKFVCNNPSNLGLREVEIFIDNKNCGNLSPTGSSLFTGF